MPSILESSPENDWCVRIIFFFKKVIVILETLTKLVASNPRCWT